MKNSKNTYRYRYSLYRNTVTFKQAGFSATKLHPSHTTIGRGLLLLTQDSVACPADRLQGSVRQKQGQYLHHPQGGIRRAVEEPGPEQYHQQC